MTPTDRIAAIARRLWAAIPAPYKRPPKAAKSWAALKPGDVMVSKDNGTAWYVDKVDSDGADLEQIADKPARARLHDRDWAERFTKMTRREAKKRGTLK